MHYLTFVAACDWAFHGLSLRPLSTLQHQSQTALKLEVLTQHIFNCTTPSNSSTPAVHSCSAVIMLSYHQRVTDT